MMEFILGYDFGTSGVKAILIDSQGNIQAVSEKSYPLLQPKPLFVEQDPNDYWEAVCSVTKNVMHDSGCSPEAVKGLSFSVQAINIIPVDREGNILCNAISWLDGRASEEAMYINNICGAPLVRPQDHQSRLLWIKNNLPDIYNKTYAFLDCDSFLQYKCTGKIFAEPDDPGINKVHPAIREYIDGTLAAAGIDTSKLPSGIQAHKVFGVLDETGAADLDLCPGIPVFGGMIDVPAAAAGCGCLKDGDAHLYLGTSGWLSALITEPVNTSEGAYLLPSIDPELLIYGGCTNSCCKMLNWTIDKFYSAEHEQMQGKIFDYINDELAALDPGCEGLFAAPWIFGEQFPVCDSNARGMFFNIREDHKRIHFIEAVMESICFSMKWQIELFQKDTGRTLDKVGANGGGSLSDHWMQMMADIAGIPVTVPASTLHSGAIGAAVAAAIGLGWCSFDDADSFIGVDKTFTPRSEYRELYEKKYNTFKKLYDISKDLFNELNA